jgi:transcriptional regulator with XRE-family HTH domain
VPRSSGRLEAGLSQERLAKRLDASQAYVSQVEHGKGLSVEQLRLFSDALEEEGKGDREDAAKKRERKRTRGG